MTLAAIGQGEIQTEGQILGDRVLGIVSVRGGTEPAILHRAPITP